MINLPIDVDINNLIDDLRTFSWEAADVFTYYSQILKDSDSKNNIMTNKNSHDPVTLVDLKVNEIIIRRINEKYKDINWAILSEENVKVDTNSYEFSSDWLWILDPLDGTRDFIQGTGNYAMQLALVYKKRPLIGVLLIPKKNELWFSTKEKVWCEKKDGSHYLPNLSENILFKDMTIVTSKNHRNEILEKLIKRIKFRKTVVMGSIGCKIASILRGESDIYISVSLPGESAPKDWDFAAPEAILKAAGGAVTNLNNQELLYNNPDFEQRGIIVASNNNLNHKNICSKIKEIVLEIDSNIFRN